jgi:mannose-6-phosphate isomerase-like protein (cupin superfamily)
MPETNSSISKVYENPVIGDKVTFIKTSEETNGEYTLIEVQLAPKGGNTLHTHLDFTETFRPVEGTLTVHLGQKKMVLHPGESATVPLYAKHSFQNPTDSPVKFLVELRPGHAGFENSLKIVYGLAKDGLTNKKSIPNNFSHLAIIATMGGTYPVGIFSLMMPVLRWRANKARRQGVEKELIEKYC